MDDFHDSGHSSPLSSPLSSASSSPLSSPATSPSPPPPHMLLKLRENPYPSPPASQQTSQSCSPFPDGMDGTTEGTGPPPAKRRRISKERSTKHLDLRSSDVDPDQQEELDTLLSVLQKRQKIVVIAGAGISVSAGIPDFRSARGLFRSLKDEHKLKGSGKDLFDASVYKDDTSTSSFHTMVSSMSRLTKDAKPTAFHHMLATLASENRLLRLYSQNVDGIDTSLEPLKTSAPLRKDESGKWPTTVQLHGGLDKMVCSKCHELSDFDANLFSGPVAPLCTRCEEVNDIRTNLEGKRSHGIGRLRPRMVLYNEHNPDDVAIGSVTQHDLRKRPDAVIVAGTTLKVPGVRRIVREMCSTVRDRRDGVAIWLNTDLPPVSKDLEDCFDIVVQGPCDEVALRAAMRKWDDPVEEDEYAEISDSVARRAVARQAEVHVSTCKITQAAPMTLPSVQHFNNSFRPPPADVTPRKPQPSPSDWSPMPSRRHYVLSSIEHDDDTTVSGHYEASTPIKPKKNILPNATVSLNDKLRDVTKSKKPTSKIGKTSISAQMKKKPAPNSKPTKTKAPKHSKTQPKSAANILTNTFKHTKPNVSQPQLSAKKSLLSPASTPSKLRQVYSASANEPMHPVSPKDARVNTSPSKASPSKTSPSKARPVFPGLQIENTSQNVPKPLFGK